MEEYMTRDEIATWMRLKPSTIDYYRRIGLFPSVRVGKHYRYLRSEVESVISKGE